MLRRKLYIYRKQLIQQLRRSGIERKYRYSWSTTNCWWSFSDWPRSKHTEGFASEIGQTIWNPELSVIIFVTHKGPVNMISCYELWWSCKLIHADFEWCVIRLKNLLRVFSFANLHHFYFNDSVVLYYYSMSISYQQLSRNQRSNEGLWSCCWRHSLSRQSTPPSRLQILYTRI